MKIELVSLSVCLVAATLATDRPNQNSNTEKLEFDDKTGPINKASVSDFFYKTESLLRAEKSDNSRDKRLLGSKDFALGVKFGKKIFRTVLGRIGKMDLSFLSLSNFFSKIDQRHLMVLESTSTVVLGVLLAAFNPASALFGTVLYYFFAGVQSAVTLLHRLYADDEFFSLAARRLGSEGFSDDVLDNIGSALFTVADAYNFLSDLQP